MDWLRAQPIHFELSEPNLKILNVRNLTDTTQEELAIRDQRRIGGARGIADEHC